MIQLPVWLLSLAYACAGLGAIVAVWAFAWDWARRGRKAAVRRCPKCWYSMDGGAMKCPECGRQAKSKREFRRSRRRWGWAVLGVLLSGLGLAAAWCHGKSQRDVIAKLPTDVLLWYVKDLNQVPAQNQQGTFAVATFEEEAARQLWLREFEGTLSFWQRRKLASKQFEGVAGPLLLETRSDWPRGVPVIVKVQPMYSANRERSMRAESAWPDAEVFVDVSGGIEAEGYSVRAGSNRDGWWMVPAARYWRFGMDGAVLLSAGAPPVGASEIRLDVTILEEGAEIWSGAVRRPIKIVPTIDDAIAPDASPKLTQRIADHLRSDLKLGEDGRSLGVSRIAGVDDDVAVACRVIFVHHGEVKAWASLLLRRRPAVVNPLSFGDDQSESWAVIEGGPVPTDPAAAEGWSIKVESDPETALRDFRATRYWSGELELPLPPVAKGLPGSNF